MIQLRFRSVFIVVLTTLAILYALPTVMEDKLPDWYKKTFDLRMALGLDLQGGIHLVLGVEVDKAVEDKLDRTADDLKEFLKEEGLEFESIVAKIDEGVIAVTGSSDDQRKKLEDDELALSKRYASHRRFMRAFENVAYAANLAAVAERARVDPAVWLAQSQYYGDLAQHGGFATHFAEWLSHLWARGCRRVLTDYAG